MKVQIKYNFIALLTAFLVLLCLLVGAGMPSTVARASTSLIDYTSLEYIAIPGNVDYTTENVVVRFHCPSIRHIGDEDGYIEDFSDYISYLSFRQSMGGQIYFVDGVACDLEDGDSCDSPTDKFADYYEIKYYDEENDYVYITFKSLADLVANDAGAYKEGVCIFDNSDETYTESAKLAYLPDDGTDAPAEGDTDAPAENDTDGFVNSNDFFNWLEWWHILIGVYAVIGIVIGIIWKVKKG